MAFEPSLERGLEALHRGDLVAAEGHLEAALQRSPDDPFVLEGLGAVYAKTDRPARAETAFRHALRGRPDAIGSLLGLAAVLMETGRLDEAATIVDAVSRGAPGNRAALVKRALIDVRRGRAEAAEETARRVLAEEPHHAEASYVLGLALEQRGLRKPAVAAMRQAHAGAPGHLGALSHLVSLSAALGDAAGALRWRAAYDEVLDRRRVEERMRKHRLEGIGAFNRGDYRTALEAFRAIAVEAPRDPQVHLHIGSAHLALGEYDAAQRELETSLALDPHNDRALAELGRLHALANRLDQAEESLRRAIAVNPEFPEPHYYLAGVLRARGDSVGFGEEIRRFEELRARSRGSTMEIVTGEGP